MLSSTLTSKGQATIPAEIRHALKLRPGDKVVFKIYNHQAVISKAEPIDYYYHAGVSANLNEWDSPEDDDAYGNL